MHLVEAQCWSNPAHTAVVTDFINDKTSHVVRALYCATCNAACVLTRRSDGTEGAAQLDLKIWKAFTRIKLER
jgi:hypothetical protein